MQSPANRSWTSLSGARNISEILYPNQISAALNVEDIPLALVWTQDMWAKILAHLDGNQPIGPSDYPGCQQDVELAIERWLRGVGRALVVGSVSPWIEAILFRWGCREIFTLDLAKIYSEIQEVTTVTYGQWEQLGLKADLILSFSTVEHIGLGRYGDTEDQEADIKWMRHFALNNLAPGGVHLLGIPVGEMSICSSTAHRIYGPDRMERLLEGWRFLETIFDGRILGEIPFAEEYGGNDWQKQPLIVLEPAGLAAGPHDHDPFPDREVGPGH